MKKEYIFIFNFLFFLTLLYLLALRLYSKDNPIMGITVIATTLNNILNYLGINSIQTGDIIHLPNKQNIRIIVECTGLFEMIILSSIILAYPTGLVNKLYGILSGIIIIGTLNMIRLITITYILVYYTDKFELVDTYLWQIGTVIFISLGYTTWLKIIRSSNSLS